MVTYVSSVVYNTKDCCRFQQEETVHYVSATNTPDFNHVSDNVYPMYNPEYQFVYQPVYYPEYDPEYTPEYQPVYYPEYDPEYTPVYQPVYYPEYDPEYTPVYQPVYYPEYNPEYQFVYQPVYYPEYDPEYNPVFQPVYYPENYPEYTPEYYQVLPQDFYPQPPMVKTVEEDCFFSSPQPPQNQQPILPERKRTLITFLCPNDDGQDIMDKELQGGTAIFSKSQIFQFQQDETVHYVPATNTPDFAHTDNIYPKYNPEYYQVLPPDVYPQPPMVERVEDDCFLPSPQLLQFLQPFLPERKHSMITNQDPNDGDQDIMVNNLLGDSKWVWPST
ncbi:adhesive plaque matrix protein-like isoform X1 [Tachysurus ichikawai]